MIKDNGCGFILKFSPDWWNLIGSTRIFVASFCSAASFGVEAAPKVAMVVHELLENAVKYSADHNEMVSCDLQMSKDGVKVGVSNVTTAAASDFLQQEVQRVMQGDPFETYLEKMRQSLSNDFSRLGLARIRYEAGATLAVQVQGKRVEIWASIPYQGAPAQMEART